MYVVYCCRCACVRAISIFRFIPDFIRFSWFVFENGIRFRFLLVNCCCYLVIYRSFSLWILDLKYFSHLFLNAFFDLLIFKCPFSPFRYSIDAKNSTKYIIKFFMMPTHLSFQIASLMSSIYSKNKQTNSNWAFKRSN